MSRILISLGMEDLKLRRNQDSFVFDDEELSKITDLFIEIEAIGRGLGRYGCTIQRLFQRLIRNKIIMILARIRTGNDEEIRFFKDIDEKVGFLQAHNLADLSQENNFHKEIEMDGIIVSQRISVYEIYEVKQLERLINACNEIDSTYIL